MKEKVYHPISGEYVFLDSLTKDELLIENPIYKPSVWRFFSLKKENKSFLRFYGFEVELNIIKSYNSRLTIHDCCKILIKELNKDGAHFHIMKDRSVRNGIEIVSHPMSYNYIKEHIDFNKLETLLNNIGAVCSLDTGFHIHVTSKKTPHERNLVLCFFFLSLPLWITLSRRKIPRLQNRYVSTEYFFISNRIKSRHFYNLIALHKQADSFVDFTDISFDNYDYTNRYSAVNFSGSGTIEFRIFSGSTKAKDMYDSINFVKSFMNLIDEISLTRRTPIYKLHDFVKQTQSQDLLLKTVSEIRKANHLLQKGKLYYSYSYSIDCFWYESLIKYAQTGDYIITKQHYQSYIELRNKISNIRYSYQIYENYSLKEVINDYLMDTLYEIIKNDNDYLILSSPMSYDIKTIKIKKKNFHKNYILLKVINKNLLIIDNCVPTTNLSKQINES